MSTEDLEQYEADLELLLYKEYKDVCPMFTYVVETERRFYLANDVKQTVNDHDGRTHVHSLDGHRNQLIQLPAGTPR